MPSQFMACSAHQHLLKLFPPPPFLDNNSIWEGRKRKRRGGKEIITRAIIWMRSSRYFCGHALAPKRKVASIKTSWRRQNGERERAFSDTPRGSRASRIPSDRLTPNQCGCDFSQISIHSAGAIFVTYAAAWKSIRIFWCLCSHQNTGAATCLLCANMSQFSVDF